MYRKTLLVCAVLAALAACAKPDPEQVKPEPAEEQNAPEIRSLSAESLFLYPAEYAVQEAVTFSVKDADEVKADADPGISANLKGVDEEYTLTISAEGEFDSPAKVILTAQNGHKETTVIIGITMAGLVLDCESYRAPRAGASIGVTAISNVGAVLKSVGGNWIHVEPGDGTFAITIDRNETFSERSADVIITDAKGIFTRIVSISQDAAIDYATNERKALVAIWESTGGEGWNELSNSVGGKEYSTANWGTDAPIDTWYGVTVNQEGHVIYLHLSGVGLKGTLPEEMGNLAYLQELWLSGNSLSGSLPESLGKLTVLKDVDLSGMSLSGSLEASSFKDIAPHLKNVSLSGNLFTGGFPEWVGNLPENANFWLQSNCLEGKVPDKVKAHPRWNAEAMDGTGRTIGQINMEQREGYVLE